MMPQSVLTPAPIWYIQFFQLKKNSLLVEAIGPTIYAGTQIFSGPAWG